MSACCSVLQRVAACCSVLQRVAVCCSVLQCVVVCFSVLQCVAVCCSALQRVAVCCSEIKHFSFAGLVCKSCLLVSFVDLLCRLTKVFVDMRLLNYLQRSLFAYITEANMFPKR